MKTLVKVVVTIVTAGAMAAGAARAADVVKVGISAEPYPPFTYLAPNGKWTGFEIDLQHAICERAGVQCETVPTAWAGIIPALQTGKIDAIMNSMTITKVREKIINFTHPYYETHLEWVAPVGTKTPIPDGYKGKLVGVQGGTQFAIYGHKVLAPLGVHLKIYAEQSQESRDLLAGRIDAMVADSVYTHSFVQKHPDMADVGRAKWVAQEKGIALRKDEAGLETKLNKGIEAVLKDGTCRQLSQKYLGVDVCSQP